MTDLIGRLNAALEGRYRIERELGRGGMATVYLADDLRHERRVALKLLKPELAAVVGVERFLAEIKTTASLHHPHILPLHDSGDADGLLFYVMPYVEGESLRDRLNREHQLPVDEAVRIAADVAEALDYAHSRGVIHRDIKPANILLQSGRPLVSDFGIALAIEVSGGSRLTKTGLSLGTPHYMSPEQATGDLSVGAATDIYALGCVLYEMLVGGPPYTGSTPQAILGKIVTGQPESVSEQRKSVPANVDYAVRIALEKIPADRFSTAARFGEALADPGFGSDAARGAVGQGRRPVAPLQRVAVALAVLASMTLALWIGRTTAPMADTRRPSVWVVSFEQEMGQTGEIDQGVVTMPAPSPTGRYVVFRGATLEDDAILWIRPLGSAEARPLRGTEGATGTVVWSPDGEWIGFFADGRLMKIRPEGGPPQLIAELVGFQDADWGAQGDILFRPGNRDPLYVIHEDGGSVRQVTWLNEDLTENSHRGVEFLPDGRRFLFTTRCAVRSNNALYVGSLDSSDVRRLMPAEAQVSHVPTRGDRPEALFYYSEGALVARAFDGDSETFIGDPVPVTEGVDYSAASIHAAFRVSEDGSVIVIRPSKAGEARLTWFRRDGTVIGTVGPAGRSSQPRISPNGESVLFQAANPQNGNRDVWHVELARGIVTALTDDIANDWYPVWSPDGTQMLFGSDRNGASRVYLKTSLDRGTAATPISEAGRGVPRDWSLDGRWISYQAQGDIWVASMPGGDDPFPFLESSAVETNGRFSPDGKWIAYVSNETGQWEVHVRPFDGGPADAGRRIQISTDGGDFPVWGPEGRELYYMSRESFLYAVDTADLGSAGSVSLPRRLFKACPDGRPTTTAAVGSPWQPPYDTRDGEEFLISCLPASGQFEVLLDWAWPT